jgi:hypothetical protein
MLTKNFQKAFYSIEYIDSDGDLVIKHKFMTQEEANGLIEGFAKNRMKATINRLSDFHSVVSSGYEFQLKEK